LSSKKLVAEAQHELSVHFLGNAAVLDQFPSLNSISRTCDLGS